MLKANQILISMLFLNAIFTHQRDLIIIQCCMLIAIITKHNFKISLFKM